MCIRDREGAIRIGEVVLFDFMKSYAVAHDMQALADPFYHWPRKGEKQNDQARRGKLFLLRINQLKTLGLVPKETVNENAFRGLDLPLITRSFEGEISYEERIREIGDSINNIGDLPRGSVDNRGLFANLGDDSRMTSKEGSFGLVYRRRAYDQPPFWLRK